MAYALKKKIHDNIKKLLVSKVSIVENGDSMPRATNFHETLPRLATIIEGIYIGYGKGIAFTVVGSIIL